MRIARLPDVDTAQRDDVVEEEGGATGSRRIPAPTGTRVTSDTDDSVSLSWNADAGAYKVEYRRSGSISWYVYSSTSDGGRGWTATRRSEAAYGHGSAA